MNIQFGAATLVRGSADKVEAYVKQKENIVGNVATIKGGGNEAIVLDGKDAATFLKQEYNVEIPAEFLGQDAGKLEEAVNRNPVKFLPMIVAIMKMIADGPALDQKIERFFERIKAAGADAEGNPVREVDV